MKDLVIGLLNEQLTAEKKVCQQIFEERVYLAIVDKLQAGELPEEIARAAGELYNKLLEAEFHTVQPNRTIAARDLDELIVGYIFNTFNRGVEKETVVSEFTGRGYKSITIDDIERCMAILETDDNWK